MSITLQDWLRTTFAEGHARCAVCVGAQPQMLAAWARSRDPHAALGIDEREAERTDAHAPTIAVANGLEGIDAACVMHLLDVRSALGQACAVLVPASAAQALLLQHREDVHRFDGPFPTTQSEVQAFRRPPPDGLHCQVHAARLALSAGSTDRAISMVAQAARRADEASRNHAVILLADWHEALLRQIDAPSTDPRWVSLHAQSAAASRALGDAEGGLRQVEEGIERGLASQAPSLSALFLSASTAHRDGHRYRRATALLARAEEHLRPQDHEGEARLRTMAATLFFRMGRLDRAAAMYDLADAHCLTHGLHVSRATNTVLSAYLNFSDGFSLQERERVEGALALLSGPDGRPALAVEALLLLATVACLAEDYGRAEALVREATVRAAVCTSRPLLWRAHNVLGEIQRALGDPLAATESYRRAVAYSNEALIPRLNLVITAALTGDLEGAWEVSSEALRVDLRHDPVGSINYLVGMAHHASVGDLSGFDQCLAASRRLLEGNPEPDVAALARLAAKQAAKHPTEDWQIRRARALNVALCTAHASVDPADEDALWQLRGLGTPIPLDATLLLEPIGRGGAGEVWRAFHEPLGQHVAVKVLSDCGPGRIARFQSEIRTVASLEHPHIVAVLDHGVVSPGAAAMSGHGLRAGSPYLVMELAGPDTLATVCGQVPWNPARRALLELLAALAYAHAHDVLHCDIKPGNVMINPSNQLEVRLVDFGVASTGEAAERQVVGTPLYMAPEQIRADSRLFGPWTDLYAVGVLATELLTGTPTFGHIDTTRLYRAHLEDPPPAPLWATPVPDGMDDWIARCLAKDPRDRFWCAADAAQALHRLEGAGEMVQWRVPRGIARAAPTFVMGSVPETLTLSPQSVGRPIVAPPGLQSTTLPTSQGDRGPALSPGARRLRPSPLVGRQMAQDQLWALLEQAAAGSARLVYLTGAGGSGRTRLAQWLRSSAAESGLLGAAWSVQCSRGEELRAVLIHALRAPTGHLHATLLQLGLSDEVASVLAHPNPQDDVLAATQALLRAVVPNRPGLLTLDDQQFAPELNTLLEQLVGTPLRLLVVCTRDLPPNPLPAGAIHVALEPLTEETVTELIRSEMEIAPYLARWIARHTGGLPRLAMEVCDRWLAAGDLVRTPTGMRLAVAASPGLPRPMVANWAEKMADQLDALSPRCRRTMELAAVCAPEAHHATLEAACRTADAASPEVGLERALGAGLVRRTATGWRFAHSLIAEGLLSDRSPSERRARHATLLSVMEERATLQYGRHLLGADRPRDAAAVLTEVAEDRLRDDPHTCREAAVLALGALRSLPRTPAGAHLRLRIDRLIDSLDASGPLQPSV